MHPPICPDKRDLSGADGRRARLIYAGSRGFFPALVTTFAARLSFYGRPLVLAGNVSGRKGDSGTFYLLSIERRVVINVIYNFLESYALNLAKTFAVHTLNALIPNHVFPVLLVV